MNFPARSTTAALALALGAATAQPAPAPAERPAEPPPPASLPAASPGPLDLPSFEELDGDHDRVLTLDEVPAGTVLHRDFAHWDANKDGVLNQPEYRRLERQLAQLD